MPTSELSNALNPYIIQDRPRQSVAEYPVPLQQVASVPQQYVPHRSELELAISEPQPPLQPAPQRRPTLKQCGQLSQEYALPFQEYLRAFVMTREAQEEIERKRRLAWEQEQEAKSAQRQAETDRTIFEMRQEIQALHALFNRQAIVPGPLQQQSPLISQLVPAPAVSLRPATSTGGLFTPHYSMSSGVQEQTMPQQPSTPITPTSISRSQILPQSGFAVATSQKPYPPYPLPSSDQPPIRPVIQQNVTYSAHTAQPQSQHVYQNGLQPQGHHRLTIQSERHPIAQSVTPSPSPQLSVSQPPTDSSLTGTKRKASEVSSDGNPNTDTDDSVTAPVPRIKRLNHHDKRCLTIQHAMRLHLLRCMELENDKHLPDSHAEGTALDDSQAVRFVWDKTTKQSLHNARMKTRILADLKAERSLYKHVPGKDFGKKVLGAAFEQCFVTFRQKFKAQNDAAAATSMKRREDLKARRARHLSRRKLKLSNRAEVRQNLSMFEHATFDGAFQTECMSSEESDDDEPESPSSPKSDGVLRTRGYEWRSMRLTQFYCILDDEERADKSTKPKRGAGKRSRRAGPSKEGFHLPPKGVATWMISRKWLNNAQRTQPDLAELLSKLVVDPPGFDWDQFEALGAESDIEGEHYNEPEIRNLHAQQLSAMQIGQSQFPSTSSLDYALVQ